MRGAQPGAKARREGRRRGVLLFRPGAHFRRQREARVLSAPELQALGRIADALFPALDGPNRLWRAGATHVGIEPRVAERAAAMGRDALDRLRAATATFERTCPKAQRPLSLRDEEHLMRLSRSRHPDEREAFACLRSVLLPALLSGYAAEPLCPLFADIGYPGPIGEPPRTSRRLRPVPVSHTTHWTADVVIVGSGSGGSVAAAVLAGAGLDVVVLERGPHVPEAELTHLEHDVEARMSENLPTSGGIVLHRARCLGGSTVLGPGVAAEPPPRIRRELDRSAGFANLFDGGEFRRSLREVEERTGVTVQQSKPSARDRKLVEGFEALGWPVLEVPRPVRGCPQDDGCGFCSMGCRLGAKQSATNTWLRDASRAGARLVVGADVHQLRVIRGRVHGVEARVGQADLSVRARAVVLAAGGLGSPLLMMRSGVDRPALGRTLALHPTALVLGRFEAPIDPFCGPDTTRTTHAFADLDGEGYGVWLSSRSLHPASFVRHMGWDGACRFKRDLASYRHWLPVAVRVRDRGKGRVRPGRGWGVDVETGRMDMRRPDDAGHDAGHLRHGILRAAQALVAAGALEVRAGSERPVAWLPGTGQSVHDWARRLGDPHNPLTLYSEAQMGTTRIGNDRGVVDENHEVYGVRGLYVMDSGCLPQALGVSPTLTVQAMAHRAARALAHELG